MLMDICMDIIMVVATVTFVCLCVCIAIGMVKIIWDFVRGK